MNKLLTAFTILLTFSVVASMAQDERPVRYVKPPSTELHKQIEAHRVAVAAELASHTVSVEIDYDREAVQAVGPQLPFPIPGMRAPANPFSTYELGPFTGLVVGANQILITDRCLGDFSESGAGNSVQAITVTLPNGERWPARVVGRHQQIDLALLELDCIIEETCPALNVFTIPAERAELKRGESVIVVGRGQNPLGTLVNSGIVSAVDRELGRAFQMDARIGNSTLGAPVVNRDGKLVGVVTLHNHERFGQASGISYAAYIDEVREAYDLLKEGKFIERPPTPFMGVGVEKKWPDKPGLEVGSVQDGTGAQKAGLRIGDIILKVNDRDMNDFTDLAAEIQRQKVGATIKVVILRDEQKLELDIVLGTRP